MLGLELGRHGVDEGDECLGSAGGDLAGDLVDPGRELVERHGRLLIAVGIGAVAPQLLAVESVGHDRGAEHTGERQPALIGVEGCDHGGTAAEEGESGGEATPAIGAIG